MNNATDKVRAALDAVIDNAVICESSYSFTCDGAALGMLKNARRELDGKVLVPVEPTKEMLAAGKQANNALFVMGSGGVLPSSHFPHNAIYTAMIAPYLSKERCVGDGMPPEEVNKPMCKKCSPWSM